MNQVIIGTGGDLREEVVHENLELALAKYLTRKDERVESQSKGTEKKILIPSSFCGVGR